VVLTTPIIEGLDGVQKMSKSLNNAIGITEKPDEMYGKLMSISDELMWRYWELLTDLSAQKITEMQSQVSSGALHPMKAKKELAEKIVGDFHSADFARQAATNWEKQFQRDEVPENLEKLELKAHDLIASDGAAGEVKVRLDKLLKESGFTSSRSEAERKIKERAVKVNGEVVESLVLSIAVPDEITIRLGKRIKQIRLT